MTQRLSLPIRIITIVVLFPAIFHPVSSMGNDETWMKQRLELIDVLRKQGITNQNVISAMIEVPRHEFVPLALRNYSYLNQPLPIGHDQTISQPYIVAYMCQALDLKEDDRVLEIGTGSGYNAAVMSQIVETVYSIEIIPDLGTSAEKLLGKLGYSNIEINIGDGYQGWPEHAPFSAIILTAAPSEIPQPLIDQLAENGRLLAPVGTDWQDLVLVEKTPDGLMRKNLIPVRFVPMTGEAEKPRVK